MVTGKQKLICVVGTTASGKSDFGVELAKKYGGEIVSADSRQVFRGLDLGSGKITPEEMQGVPHHLLDVRNPNEFFSMADFQAMAYEAIDDILRRGRLPLLVGGTGLYVDSVAEGYLLSGEAPDLAYRAHLETFETPALYQMLLQVMPDTDVDPKNRNRVMRLLERIHAGDDLTPSLVVDVRRVVMLGGRVAHGAVELADVIHAVAAKVRLSDLPVLVVCRDGKRLLIREQCGLDERLQDRGLSCGLRVLHLSGEDVNVMLYLHVSLQI